MSYQVIARKWRPQNFDEVVFQEHVSRTIQNSISNGRISHSYIFSGPRGVGKTTMARILARALNCIDGPTPEPCGKCDNCLEIKAGSSFDIIEIDGASNRGIDDIKELRNNVNFAPVKSNYKVFIIDEVHMLTKEAFNALLKTLEEPPPHIVFIFATTEIHQIPDTILSRCQKFFFKKIPFDPIVSHLRHIVEKEGFRISDNALFPIARASGGSMRDAQSLLEQVISFSLSSDGEVDGVEIGEDDTLAILGIVPIESYIRQMENIASMDPVAAMDEVERISSMGVDISRYVEGFVNIIRTVRLVRNGISVKNLLGLSESEIEVTQATAKNFFDEEIGRIYSIADELYRNLRFANSERVNLEMAIFDMISVKRSPSISSIIEKLETTAITPQPIADKSQNGEDKKKTTLPDKETINKLWEKLILDIENSKKSLHFILKPASIDFSNGIIHVVYPPSPEYDYYHKTFNPDYIDYIKDYFSKKLNIDIKVKIKVESDNSLEINNRVVNEVKNEIKKDEKNVPENNNFSPEDKPAVKKSIIEKIEEPPPVPDAEMMESSSVEEYERLDPTVEKIKNKFHGEIVKKGE